MDSHYRPIYQQAASMQHFFHDYTHAKAADPTARILRQQIHGLTNDLATNQKPKVIENRLRTIQNHLERAQTRNPLGIHAQGSVINNTQKNFLHSNFERMRQNVIQHPSFR